MQHYNVLLVDDETNIIKSLERSLRKYQFNIYSATTGADALAVLMKHKQEGFLLIISDQKMPGMSGLELLSHCKRILPDSSRIILTGYTIIDTAIEAINTGSVDYFILKPWNEASLHKIIDKMIERYELISKNQQLNQMIQEQNNVLKKLNQELEIKVQERTGEIQRQKDNLNILNQDLLQKNAKLEKLYKDLEESFIFTVKSYIRLLEFRDPFIANHCKRVAVMALEIAKHLDFNDEDLIHIEIAGLLHDIGKISLPDGALLKNLKNLSDIAPRAFSGHSIGRDELFVMRRNMHKFDDLTRNHPVWGESLLNGAERLLPIGKIVRNHHEMFDGSGYPDGLKGQSIPLASRIIQLADFCDKALNKRPWEDYVYGMSLKDYLLRKSHSQFDPELVETYIIFASESELRQVI